MVPQCVIFVCFLKNLFTLVTSITKNKARNYGTDMLHITPLQRNVSIGNQCQQIIDEKNQIILAHAMYLLHGWGKSIKFSIDWFVV